MRNTSALSWSQKEENVSSVNRWSSTEREKLILQHLLASSLQLMLASVITWDGTERKKSHLTTPANIVLIPPLQIMVTESLEGVYHHLFLK